MELVGAAAVVAVHDHDFRAFATGFLDVVAVRETKHVLLESSSGRITHKLFLSGDRNPSLVRHAVENGGSREKTVSVRSPGVRVFRENRGSEAAQFGIFKGAMKGIAVSAKGLVGRYHVVRWFSFLAEGQCVALPTDVKKIPGNDPSSKG